MKRGQIFVRGINRDGKWGTLDVLDLDSLSFRAFILDVLVDMGVVCSIKDDHVDGDKIVYREAKEG